MSTIERIIELMKENNIKDAELERMLGLKPKIIYGWKTGRSKSYMDFIPQLSQIFNVSSEYLLCISDDQSRITSNTENMTTVERIKKHCKIKGIAIQTLEKEIGLSNGAISKWDKSSPNSESLMKVANYLDCSVDYLLGRVDDPHSEIPVALSAPQGYENLTDEQKELIQALIDQYAQRNKE